MTVNLLPFLNHDVVVTFRNGQVHEGRLENNGGNTNYPFWFETEDDGWSFEENGSYISECTDDKDIVGIRLTRGVFQGTNATEKVAMALLPDIAAGLQEDEDFQNFLRQKIERQLDKLLEGGLVGKALGQATEVLAQNIVVTVKAQ